MYVNLNRYLYTILNVCLVNEKILGIDHKGGLILYIFKKKNIPIPDRYFNPSIDFYEYSNYNLHNKFYIELTNKYLPKQIDIEEIIFRDIELILRVIKSSEYEPIEYSIKKNVIKIKDILSSVGMITDKNLKEIDVLKVEYHDNGQKIIINISYAML